jgi:organic radical activating enzyme
MSELPVFEYGCDSSYSWSPRFKKLAKDYSVTEVVDEILRIGRENLGLTLKEGEESLDNWTHTQTRMPAQICFTGGEPMMQQKAIELILNELEHRSLNPIQVTIETNATKELVDSFGANLYTKHVHMSCSPKLYTVSGEQDVIDYGVLASYITYADSGAIKFVHNGSQEAWEEIDSKMDTLRDLIRGEPWQLWIMPAHATLDKGNPEYIGKLCDEALKRGFWISLRMHIYAYGNQVGK